MRLEGNLETYRGGGCEVSGVHVFSIVRLHLQRYGKCHMGQVCTMESVDQLLPQKGWSCEGSAW
jgi:hypothetical protein